MVVAAEATAVAVVVVVVAVVVAAAVEMMLYVIVVVVVVVVVAYTARHAPLSLQCLAATHARDGPTARRFKSPSSASSPITCNYSSM